MKKLKKFLGVFLLLATVASPDPTDYTRGVDELGWPIWQSESLPGQSFLSAGALLTELSKQQSADWLLDQANQFPDSRQLQIEAARRLAADGRHAESSKLWKQANLALDESLHLEAGRHFYQQRQWGKALKSLSRVHPHNTDFLRTLLAKDPTLSRIALPSDHPLTFSQQESGNWKNLELGQEHAKIDRGRGRIFLPHVSLQIEVEPALAVDQLASRLAGTQGVKEKLGQSVKGKAIDAYYFGHGPELVVFFGAFHGNEPESAKLMFRFVAHLQSHPELLQGRTAIIVPVVNPDGLAREGRRNANEVDLNRNYPTSNWNSEGEGTDYWGGKAPASEPETQIVVDLLERFQPVRIISVHAPYRCVNFDGPAEKLAHLLSQENGYKVEPSIGYPTPGSFGTYAGIEKKIPTITLELPPEGTEDVWKDNRRALVKALRGDEEWPALHAVQKSSD